MKRVNLCILGCGSVARLHSRVARTLRGQVSLLFASRSRERAEKYKKAFRGIGAFGSYEEACGHDSVDAVFICTPHAHHLEHVRLAAAGGKALLIEKPVARSLEELSEIEKATAEADLVSMVAENYYFKPLTRVLRYHIQRGDIGHPMFIELKRVGRSKTSGWRTDAEMMGGGALLEGGIHWVNLMRSIGGEVKAVVAAKPQVPIKQVAPYEDSLELLFKFADGSVGRLLHSWNLVNRIGGLSMSRVHGSNGNLFFESNGLFAIVAGIRKRFRIPGLIDIMGYRSMLGHFLECVRDNRNPSMSLALARRDMQVVEAAYRSLESGRFEGMASP